MSTTASATSISDLRLPKPSLPSARPAGRCVVVSDRLPILLTRGGGKGWRVSPSGGALLSALKPVLHDRRGVWIGWPGVTQEEAPGLRKVLAGAIQEGGGFSLRPVSLTEQEKRLGYEGFSGEALWPLFHDLPLECTFSPAHWQAFLKVNRKFARAAARTLARGAADTDLVWVQGHLLMNLAAELKRLGATCRTAFFFHLPFPGPDLFLKIPWREELLAGLLSFDQLGFQTRRDFANFLACVKALAPASHQRVRAGVFPVGVDAQQIEERAAGPEVEARLGALRSTLGGRRLIFGIDGLDRSKGIPEKLRAFAELLTRHPELQDQVTLVQVATPSLEGGARHAALRAEIERLTGEINGYFGRPGWVPVHYFHRDLDRDELLAYYRAADVALVTPLRAGMHLAAKEFCAANLEERGVLVLSEFAGAAEQLGDCRDPRDGRDRGQGALLVNPFDSQETARALYRALRMRDRERTTRMRKLRAEVRRHDVSWWAGSFLASALAEPLGERPALRNS